MHRSPAADLILHLSRRIAEAEARTAEQTTAIMALVMDGLDASEAEAALWREMDTLADLRLVQEALLSMHGTATGPMIH